MIRLLAWLLAAVPVTLAGVHAYWAGGGLWPATTEKDLIYTVIGDPRFVAMPPMWMTLCVAGALLVSAAMALLSLRRWSGLSKAGLIVLLLGITAVFALRGGAGMAIAMGVLNVDPPWTEPFATLDTYIYSPLCLILGLGFAILTLDQFRGERR